MTAAELVVLGGVLALLLWLLRPLQRAVRNLVERLLLRSKHGKVIEGRFRSVDRNPHHDDDDDASSNDPNDYRRH